jgi:hypothetical protein
LWFIFKELFFQRNQASCVRSGPVFLRTFFVTNPAWNAELFVLSKTVVLSSSRNTRVLSAYS